MQKVFVTGIERAVGASLAREFATRFEVYGFTTDADLEVDDFETVPVQGDLVDSLVDELEHQQPFALIHCGPTSFSSWEKNVTECKQDAAVTGTQRLLAAAQSAQARVLLISTDAVCQGPRLFHDCDSPAQPHNAYSAAALAVEEAALAAGAQVIRTHAFGTAATARGADFAERLWESIAEGCLLQLNPQAFATPIYAGELAPRVLRAFDLGTAGLWHIAGAERINQVRFATELAAAAGFGPISWKKSSVEAQVRETSLDCRQARALLRMPLPLARESLEGFCEAQSRRTTAKLPRAMAA